MSAALRLPPRMTVAEFLEWEPDDALWQLRDGEPEGTHPASDRHGSVHAELAYLLGSHFHPSCRRCRAVISLGVFPDERSDDNRLASRACLRLVRNID
jgi:Uma2 family endonuclease